ARTPSVGRGWPQQPYQYLLVRGALWVCDLAVLRSAQPRPCERRVYSADIRASRIGALLQSARAKDHRRQAERRQGGSDGQPAVQHWVDGGLLDADAARNGAGGVVGHGVGAA